MSRRHADNWSHPSHYLVDPYHWSHLRPGVQSICLLFVSWQSDHFWLRYSKFYIWPWKFKVKIMAKVKPAGHIWAPEFNRYVCFSFRGNRTIFGWDIANSIFDLEKSRSRSRRKSTKMLSGNLQVRANNCAKNERNPKSCSKVIAWTRICGRRRWRRWRRRRRRTNRYKNIKSPPVYWGDLKINLWHQSCEIPAELVKTVAADDQAPFITMLLIFHEERFQLDLHHRCWEIEEKLLFVTYHWSYHCLTQQFNTLKRKDLG